MADELERIPPDLFEACHEAAELFCNGDGTRDYKISIAQLQATLRPAAERIADLQAKLDSLKNSSVVHTNILRGTIALTKAQAIHIAGLPADIEAKLEEKERIPEDLQELKRWIAILFDQVVYSDSYGVEGSSFSVCRWCGGGSGPGGRPGFSHCAGCLFDNDAIENKVADVWQENDAEIAELTAKNAALKTELEQEREDARRIISLRQDRIDALTKPVTDEEWYRDFPGCNSGKSFFDALIASRSQRAPASEEKPTKC